MKKKAEIPKLECGAASIRGYEHALKMAQYLGKEVASPFIGMDSQPQYLIGLKVHNYENWVGTVFFRTVNGWSETRDCDVTFIKPVQK